MRNALFAKFTQSERLKDLLLRTGNRVLVEHSPCDSFWGDGGNGAGRNLLGTLLMELRAKLRDEQTGEDNVSTGHPASAVHATSQAFGLKAPGNTESMDVVMDVDSMIKHIEKGM